MRPEVAEQDMAAGGKDRRKLRLKNGDVVTASLYLRETAQGRWAATLRFKSSGVTFQRQCGSVPGGPKAEALRAAWSKTRDEKVIEESGWTWLEP